MFCGHVEVQIEPLNSCTVLPIVTSQFHIDTCLHAAQLCLEFYGLTHFIFTTFVCIDKDTAYSTSPYVALVAQGVVDTHCGIVCFEWERFISYAPTRAGVSRFEAQANQCSGPEDHSLTVKILV